MQLSNDTSKNSTSPRYLVKSERSLITQRDSNNDRSSRKDGRPTNYKTRSTPRLQRKFRHVCYKCYLIFRSTSQEKDVFIFKIDVSAEELKHEQVQSDMEIVLLCISVAAIILALVLLTVLRYAEKDCLCST